MDGLGVLLQAFELQQQGLGDLRAAHAYEPLDLPDVENRHDAGDDRHLDADVARGLAEAVEVGVVEEQLGDDEATAGVHLALEVLQVARAVEALGMAFGITGDADAEVVARLHERGNFIPVLESSLSLDEAALPRRRVAAQGEDVT